MTLTPEQWALLELVEQRSRAAFNAAGDARRFAAQLRDTFTDTPGGDTDDHEHQEATNGRALVQAH